MTGNAPRATIEEWRPTHHPDYDVSNLGRVRSRVPFRGRGVGVEHILRPAPNVHGYIQFVMAGKTTKVHRLVAAAFIGPCPIGQEVRHKDDNPGNPRWDNLEYGTRSQNRMDCVQRGRDRSPRGEKNYRATISNEQAARLIHLVNALPRVGKSQRRPKGSLTQIALQEGVSRDVILGITGGRCWRHV